MKKIWFIIFVCLLAGACASENNADKKVTDKVDFYKAGRMYLAQGNAAKAVQAFQQAIIQNPDDANIYFSIAQIYMRLGSYDNAIEGFKNVVRLEPYNGQAYLLLGGCYDLQNKTDEAIASVGRSVAIFQKKNDTESLNRAAVALKKLIDLRDSKGQTAVNNS